MKINEIYRSIQGESSFSGRLCTFVRCTGCHLRCRWCDTEYAFYEGDQQSVSEVIEVVKSLSCSLVELTGGEPLLQAESFDLIRALCDLDYEVLIETSGAVKIDAVDPRAVIILDLKCPASGMCDAMIFENLALLKEKDEVKFVIADQGDYDWAKSMLSAHQSLSGKAIHFSPVFGEMEPQQLAEWIVRDLLPVRLQLQLHKYVWDPVMKGV